MNRPHLFRANNLPKLFILLTILRLGNGLLVAQTTYVKTYGASNSDIGWGIIATPDGGFISVGNTNNFGPQNVNVYIIKTDAMGDTVWTQVVGGSLAENGYSVVPTQDGGSIVAGQTYSFGAGNADAYLIKLDPDGNKEWSRTYGGPANEDIVSALPTTDGGYMLLGSTYSFGQGAFDLYLIKTNAGGDTLWTQTMGDSLEENGLDMVATSDGGFMILGYTKSYGAGGDDIHLTKIDNNGTVLWANTYGGLESDAGSSLIETADGGFAVTGKTHSFGAFSNDGDVFLMKTDATGTLLWTQTYGGSGTDWGHKVLQMPDGGYAIGGETYSFGAGLIDAMILRTDSLGTLQWAKAYGGLNWDYGRSMALTPQGGFLIMGQTSSFGSGNYDQFQIQTNAQGNVGCNETTVSPTQTSPTLQVNPAPWVIANTQTVVTQPQDISVHGCTVSTLCTLVSTAEPAPVPNVSIYPNPATRAITLQFDNPNRAAHTVMLYDCHGRCVFAQADVRDATLTIQRRNWASGMYFVRLQDAGGELAFVGRVVWE